MVKLLLTICYGFLGMLTSSLPILTYAAVSEPTTIVSPLATVKSLTTPEVETATLSEDLHDLLEPYIHQIDGTVAIIVTNLETGGKYMYNEDQSFPAASLYKLWIMAATVDYVKKEKISFDQQLSDSVEAINSAYKLSPELAELTEGYVSFTVDEAIKQMIRISHNYSALLLGKTIRLKRVQQFLDENQFHSSQIGEPPTTTANDISYFYEKLFQKRLINEESSAYMISVLEKQSLNDKLPRYLPKTIKIAHKTGELGTVSHDAGIVFHPTTPYAVVILTDTDKPTKTNDQIAQISKEIFDYFSR